MRLLIIGNLSGQIGTAAKIARDRGARVSQVATAEAALDALRAGQGADLIMIEASSDIQDLVSHLKAERIGVPVVACGIQADTLTAVKAIKAGAKEYIPLPPDEELIAAVLHAITEENNSLLYKSSAMTRILEVTDQIAGSDASVLLTGESGTGKEVIARYIHRKSKRANQPFISVNCAAIPETLLESELFGYEKGAFTGAVSRRIGKFEEANNGTLLLDEISEMDVRLQAKLLRVLQEQEIDRIGGGKPIKVNIRVLATSNRNLQAEVSKGTFREDLLFRLNVINIQLPPLRDRKDDIKMLAEHFADKYARANGLPHRPFNDEAITKLLTHSWPGNVRELENTMHRTVLLASGNQITAEAIMLTPTSSTSSSAFTPAASNDAHQPTPATSPSEATKRNDMVGRTVESVERELIIDTLSHCLGNRTHAANILGISIRTLRNKLKQYGELGLQLPPPPREMGKPGI